MDVTVRPLTEADVDDAATVQRESFDDHDRRHGIPVPETTPQRIEAGRLRMRHFLTHDPDGSWVAELDGQVVGVALALRRGQLWGLSLLVVHPQVQSRGVGRRLLHAALTYAAPDGPAVILSSRDPRAMHRYASAGFDLVPQIRSSGKVDASRLRSPGLAVREATAADFCAADAVDLAVRGAPRGPDHGVLASAGPMFVVEGDAALRGYAHLREGRVMTVAATDAAAASALLWRCLAHTHELDVEATVEHVNAGQQWAVRVIVEAGLTMEPSGPSFWRGCWPPAAYLPSGPYL